MNSATNVIALQKAICKFDTQAAFIDALNEHLSPTKAITRSRIRNWLIRDGGAPAAVCPSIEAISGINCEELCSGVRWDVLRGKAQPGIEAKKEFLEKVDITALPANNESYQQTAQV